jgi:hypothetical protein
MFFLISTHILTKYCNVDNKMLCTMIAMLTSDSSIKDQYLSLCWIFYNRKLLAQAKSMIKLKGVPNILQEILFSNLYFQLGLNYNYS